MESKSVTFKIIAMHFGSIGASKRDNFFVKIISFLFLSWEFLLYAIPKCFAKNLKCDIVYKRTNCVSHPGDINVSSKVKKWTEFRFQRYLESKESGRSYNDWTIIFSNSVRQMVGDKSWGSLCSLP